MIIEKGIRERVAGAWMGDKPIFSAQLQLSSAVTYCPGKALPAKVRMV